MAKNEHKQTVVGATSEPSSREISTAPEVPPELAKQLGLHHGHNHDGENVTTTDTTEVIPEVPTDPETLPIDDPKTDEAVDTLLKEESDELLSTQADTSHELVTPPKHPGSRRKKLLWWTIIILLLAAIGTVGAIPRTRYKLLNAAGVRASTSVTIVDDATQLPLKNVTVSVDDARAETNVQGVAKIHGLRLGSHTLTIGRIAYASIKQPVVLGWGSNPLGSYKLHAVGLQYSFYVTDYLSGKPITGVDAESDAINALSDAVGKVILTLDDDSVTTLTVQVSKDGYRAQTVTLNATQSVPPKVVLVPSQKDVFAINEAGKYNVYSSDIDGQNRKLLLAGTGTEDSNTSLVISPDNTQAALVSERQTARDSNDNVLYNLTVINLVTGTSTTVDQAEQIQPIDWIGGKLLYRETLANTTASDAARNRLVSYDYNSNAKTQLAVANQFNTILSVQGSLYYALAASDSNAALGLFKINPDGSGRQQLSQQAIWSGLHTDYNTIALQTADSWYTYTVGAAGLVKAASAPADFKSYSFVPSPDENTSAWIKLQNGQDTLLLHSNSGTDKPLTAQSGITYPVHWISDTTLVYRVASSTETAEYAVSTGGGNPRKIVDVAPTYGYGAVY